MMRAALLAALTLASACSATPAAPSAGLRLTVTQNPTFTADSLVFSMRLENLGAAAVDLTFPSSCDVQPVFSDGAGREVMPAGGGFACLTVIMRRSLGAGESLIRTVTVKSGTAPESQFIVLPPGSYTIRARLLDSEFKLLSDPLPFTLR